MQNTLRFLFQDDPFNEKRGYRQKIDTVGSSFRGLHCGDVGVDQDGVHPFFFQGFDGLRPTVIKFTGFPDLKCS
jgi:hypothetical protein